MHAIIETGGKQYKVTEGDTLFIEKLASEAGENVTFDKVLALSLIHIFCGHRNRRLQPGVPGRRQGPAAGGRPRHSVGGQHHLRLRDGPHSAGAGRISIHLHRLHRQEL